jgi:hypothetical protein
MTDAEIAARFNRRFAHVADTVLVGGAAEPVYLPAAPGRPALIRYTRDYAQSALHEIAHWCLAGPEQRARVDYGLWYQPPPRSPRLQARFYEAEVPVQAVEMLLADACGVTFHFSSDNLGRDDPEAERGFAERVRRAHRELLEAPLPTRVAAVLQALTVP